MRQSTLRPSAPSALPDSFPAFSPTARSLPLRRAELTDVFYNPTVHRPHSPAIIVNTNALDSSRLSWRGTMVAFTLPQELRALFFTPSTKAIHEVFFAAASEALSTTLANPRWLGTHRCEFTMILHTWKQRLHFRPHIHCIVPGAGFDREGRVVRVKSARSTSAIPASPTTSKNAPPKCSVSTGNRTSQPEKPKSRREEIVVPLERPPRFYAGLQSPMRNLG